MQTGTYTPPVTIWETDDAFHAALMAPGLDENSIDVVVQDDTLTIQGELALQPLEGARVIWQEFAPVRFCRVLRLGAPIDRDRIEATYRDGLLLITMPRAEEAKPRRVEVRIAESGRGNGHAPELGSSQQTTTPLEQNPPPAAEGHDQPAEESRQSS
jgi:HSP20 family protein